MKVAIISDTHWGFKRSNKVFEEHIANFHESFVEYCVAAGITTILHLGDFFDVRTNINLLTLNTVKTRFLDNLKMNNIKMHIVPGNHDCSYRNSVESNSVSMLINDYDNINVYNKPTLVKFEDNSNVLLVPWIAKEEEEEFLNIVDSNIGKTKSCLGHFEFRGFLYQKGIIAQDGMESNVFTPKFDIVLSGHYHSKSSNGNVHYLGTQYDLTWADYDEKKYFHIFDTETLELTPVENKERIFHKVFYDESVLNGDFEDLKSVNFFNKVVKVIVLKRKNMIQFDEMMDIIYSKNPYDVTVVDESIVAAQKEIKVDTSILMKSTLEIINEMIDTMEFEDYNINFLKKNMHEFYLESLK